MNLSNYLDIAPEVRSAVVAKKPVVALDSTVLSHGTQYPQNLPLAFKVEQIVREHGAIPATMAIINGRMKIGLSAGELEFLCRGEGVVQKVSRSGLPILLAQGGSGAPTAASAIILASLAGIRVFSTCAMGGVHRNAASTMDISADLQELGRTPVAVVTAGTPFTLDVGKTLEYLETIGVPVLGYQTSDFPAYHCRKSGYPVDCEVHSAAEAARIARTKWDLGLLGGLVVANPVPEAFAMDPDEIEGAIRSALSRAEDEGIPSSELSPYLSRCIAQFTAGRSVDTTIQLAYNNARVAAELAVALAKLR